RAGCSAECPRGSAVRPGGYGCSCSRTTQEPGRFPFTSAAARRDSLWRMETGTWERAELTLSQHVRLDDLVLAVLHLEIKLRHALVEVLGLQRIVQRRLVFIIQVNRTVDAAIGMRLDVVGHRLE